MALNVVSLNLSHQLILRSWLRRALTFITFALPTLTVNAEISGTDNSELELGRQIYVEGRLASGELLKGERLDLTPLEGEAAACVKCHRPSGMGSLEGNIVVPPISSRFLFAKDDNRPIALLDPRAPKNLTQPHTAYDNSSLAKAIGHGVNISGGNMNPLMPRYALDDKDLKALISYLRQLSAELSPGIGKDTVRFATILTPGVDPKQAEAMLNMMQTAFSQRNASQQAVSGRMRMPLDLIPRTLRNWELSVWELKGTADTWGEQLAEYYRKEPVFAVISGLSNSTWKPIDAFCQQIKLPCMFPSIAMPPADAGFYSLYFSRGLTLEAEVLAIHLRNQTDKAQRRLVQIYIDNEQGRAAAQALSKSLAGSTISVENRVLNSQDPQALSLALKGLSSTDAVMFWLNPSNFSALKIAKTKPPATATYISGLMAADNFAAFPKNWQALVRVVYPYELADKRHAKVTALENWLKIWNIPLLNEPLQTEVFFNLLFLSDLSSQMLDNLYRDYFVERAEDMLSWGNNSSLYPQLSLAPGQRFASKGAYIARFDKTGKLAANTDWIVP